MRKLRRNKETPKQSLPLDASMHALADSAENLVEVQSRAEEVRRVAEATRENLRRNHFGEQLQEMILSHPRRKTV